MKFSQLLKLLKVVPIFPSGWFRLTDEVIAVIGKRCYVFSRFGVVKDGWVVLGSIQAAAISAEGRFAQLNSCLNALLFQQGDKDLVGSLLSPTLT